MDLTQLSQMVTWLDEEHRRDREELAKLDQRQQNMLIANQEQARRIQDLEGRLANTTAQLTRFADLEKALQNLKNEITALLDKINDQRLQAEREAERSRMSDREAIARHLSELRKELARMTPLEEELVTRRAEDQRLGEMLQTVRQSVNTVGKELDDRTRSLPYIVEQRTQDNRRISALQTETVELLKRSEALASRFALVEEKLPKVEREIQRLQPVPDVLRNEQSAFMESQRVVDANRDRQMAVWSEVFAEQKQVLEKQNERLREFQSGFEASGRALAGLEEFRQLITREQKQVSELQRLAEERQRKELAEFVGENEQRWKKETLQWEYNLQEQQKVNRKLAERFLPLEIVTVWLQQDLETLWRLQEALVERQQDGAQRILEEVSAAVGSRRKLETASNQQSAT